MMAKSKKRLTLQYSQESTSRLVSTKNAWKESCQGTSNKKLETRKLQSNNDVRKNAILTTRMPISKVQQEQLHPFVGA